MSTTMNPLTRFLRFNLVGLVGIAVQLTTLAILNRALPHHYLLTSTSAVELTLLHNFLWHLHYTWPETRSPLATLLRFHLSNGLISLIGNFALMRLFIHSLHMRLLIANALTIACCGLANFLLAHHWAFAKTHKFPRSPCFTSRPSRTLTLITIGRALKPTPSPATKITRSQSPPCLSEEPTPHP